jgi:hypothetical protein
MKKLLGAMFIATLVSVSAMQAQALPPGKGGPGNFDCAGCTVGGGWNPGPVHWSECRKTMDGEGAKCKGGPNGCTYDGGCVSLPDDELQNGLAL